ncbi:MAG: hypothetical protein KC978_19975, partial [Candidatus Omnitrophica bacterium]|nr:hypothetical protein [Candidatus Omnitrophota bacterium]
VENVTIEHPITLLGGFAGNEDLASERDWTANVTAVQASNFGPVIRILEASQCVVDGLRISKGHWNPGGGISVTNASAEVCNCIILENRGAGGGSGGGVGVSAGFLKLTNTEIRNNDGNFGGGGIKCRDSTVEVYKCNLSQNTAGAGGAISLRICQQIT